MSIAQKSKTKPIRLTRSCNGMLMTPEEFDAVTDYDDRVSSQSKRKGGQEQEPSK
jgi:hypothetical protein